MDAGNKDINRLIGLHTGLLVLYVGLLWFYFRQIAMIADHVYVPPGGDFVNIWTAAKLALQGKAAILYDPAAYFEAQKALFNEKIEFHNYGYPPFFLPFILIFGLLPYGAAYTLWMGGTFALFAWAVHGITRGRGGKALIMLLALSPAVFINAVTGQNGFLSAALFVGGLALLRNKPLAAGLLFGLLAYKPHLGILIPLALIARGEWKAFFSAAVTVCLLIALGAALYGPAMTIQYMTETSAAQTRIMTQGQGIFLMMMPSAFAAMRIMGTDLLWGYVLSAVIALGCAATVWIVWRRAVDDNLRAAVLLIAAQFAVPYLFNYDMALSVAAICLLYPYAHTMRARPTLLALWLGPLLTMMLNFAGVPLGPLIFADALALAASLALLPQPTSRGRAVG